MSVAGRGDPNNNNNKKRKKERKEKKMFITEKLAEGLMDMLCCLAISAYATHFKVSALELSDEEYGVCEDWARKAFTALCKEWEDVFEDELCIEVKDD